MPASSFRFKQFTIRHERSAMKVGTDGVVLGAWAQVEGARRILDIGTGTGLLALMAAQRNPEARVDAVEIDEEAVAEATENIAASPWSDRIRVHGMDARRLRASEPYDLIISNPPYYPGEMSSADVSSSVAKHSAELGLDELIAVVDSLLAADGRFTVIVPFNREDAIRLSGERLGLHVKRRGPLWYVRDRPYKRVLLELGRGAPDDDFSPVTVERVPGEYTAQYRALLAPFMLHF